MSSRKEASAIPHRAEARRPLARFLWIAQSGEEGRPITAYAFGDDGRWIAFLEGRGYERSDFSFVYLVRDLNEPIPPPRLPEGFTLRGMGGEEDAAQRAIVHAAVFAPRSKMTPDAYRAFRTAPGYCADLDSVVIAPDGRFASFAMGWLDPANRIGEFEPVGTHPDFQRRGLGKAVLLRGLSRLKAHGMEQAIVYTNSPNTAALRLYESVGFQAVNTFCSYDKPIEE